MFKGLSFDVPALFEDLLSSYRSRHPPEPGSSGFDALLLSAARSYPGSEDDRALLGHESSSGHRAMYSPQ